MLEMTIVLVGSDHANDLVTHCSLIGMLIAFVDTAPVEWFSKSQGGAVT
jgi:hypothetical protein